MLKISHTIYVLTLDLLDVIFDAKILCSLIFIYVIWSYTHEFYFSPLRHIPGPFLSRISNLRLLFYIIKGNANEIHIKDYKIYGDVYVVWPNMASLCNPRDVREILNSHKYPKGNLYEAVKVHGVDNVLSMRERNGIISHKKRIGLMFSKGYLERMEDKLLKFGYLSLQSKWDKIITESEDRGTDAVANFARDFHYLTLDTIGGLAFGTNFNSLLTEQEHILEWIRKMTTCMVLEYIIPIFKISPFSMIIAPFRKGRDKLVGISKEAIKRRRKLNSDGKAPIDLLQAYLDSENGQGKARLNTDQIISDITILLTGGVDTTGLTLTWAIHIFMLYPEMYRRATAEVRSVFSHDHVISYRDGHEKLPYLEAYIYECLRFIPVFGNMFERVVPSPGITVQGYYIPQGTTIGININALCHNKDLWNEPHIFNPNRFVNNERAKREIFSFSSGVRMCIGRNLAWMELMTVLANILKNYDLSLPDGMRFGPGIVDNDGYPKLMEAYHDATTNPRYPDRDCRLVIKRRTR